MYTTRFITWRSRPLNKKYEHNRGREWVDTTDKRRHEARAPMMTRSERIDGMKARKRCYVVFLVLCTLAVAVRQTLRTPAWLCKQTTKGETGLVTEKVGNRTSSVLLYVTTAASETHMYSASAVDVATVRCILDAQEIGPLRHMNSLQPVERRESGHAA